jgi:L-malate glycosyltransferase
LTAVLIGALLDLGQEVVGLSVDYAMPPGADPLVLTGTRFEFRLLPGRRRVWRMNEGRPGRALDGFRVERQLLATQLAQIRPDLVHAHWTYEFALAALDSGLPTLVTAHDSPARVLRHSRSPFRALRYLMARQVLRQAHHATTVSDYLAGELVGLCGRRLPLVPNPVAAHVFETGRARMAGAGRRIGMVCNGWGRLKNAEAGLRAFAAFRQQVPCAELHCFGDDFGPDGRAARWAMDKALSAGVVFIGPLPHRALVQRLAGLDLLLHPSLEESFGVVVAEAMALGLPVVAGRHSGAVGWVLAGDRPAGAVSAGLLTDVRDPSAIAVALARSFDDHYAERSAIGRDDARRRFSGEAVAAAYLAAYARVLADTVTSRPDSASGTEGSAE